jgi:signal transduction histidine kinase
MSSPRYLHRTVPAWVRVLLSALVLGAALYAVLLVGGAEAVGLPVDPASWWAVGALAIGAGLACVARAAALRSERLVWSLLGAATLSWGAGFIAYSALSENANAPYPSVADALWIPFYGLLLGALAALMRAERPHISKTAWLDALIPACAVSAVASQLLVPPVATGGKPLAEQVLLLLYPALDILLVVVTVLVLALRRWKPDARWGLLALAVLGSAVGDLLWSYLVAAGTHEMGSAADLPYVLTPIAIAWAAWAPKGAAVARAEDDQVTLLLPAAAAACALGLLFYGAITADLILPSLALAVAALSAGVIRWSLALRREAQAMVLRDVAAELARKADQQAAVADLGRRAIATADADRLMGLAAEVVATILGAERVAVLELEPPGGALALRADSCGEPSEDGMQALGLAALSAGGPTAKVGRALCARIARKDGTWGVMVVVHEHARDFGDDDVSFLQAVANVLGAVVTRAREEQLEAQLQQSRRLESVGKLAGGVAHDFNNLLAVILNYADFALEAATDEEQRRDLVELSKAATRGAELVRQLLAFSRRRPVDAVAVDLAELVRDMEPMLRRTIGEDVELRCWVPSELPPTVIDPGQVTQLLMNLTVNARDAMPDGGRLTIQLTETEAGVELVVADTGLGMSEETQAKAFDPFFTTKPPGSGTGLGLATVYGIVSQAGGTVSLHSQPAHGTRVVVELPCGEPLYSATSRAQASAQ